MMLNGRNALVGLTLLSAICGFGVSTTHAADDRTGYLSLTVGGAFPDGDAEISEGRDDFGDPTPDADLSLESDWAWSGAIGAYIDPFRLEVQYAAMNSDVDKWTWFVEPTQEIDGGGLIHSNLFMLNLYYDLPITKHVDVYIGGGVGGNWVSWEGSDDVGSLADNQDGWGLAYQGMIGVSDEIYPNTHVTLGYRFVVTETATLDNHDIDLPNYHIVEVGLRFSL